MTFDMFEIIPRFEFSFAADKARLEIDSMTSPLAISGEVGCCASACDKNRTESRSDDSNLNSDTEVTRAVSRFDLFMEIRHLLVRDNFVTVAGGVPS